MHACRERPFVSWQIRILQNSVLSLCFLGVELCIIFVVEWMCKELLSFFPLIQNDWRQILKDWLRACAKLNGEVLMLMSFLTTSSLVIDLFRTCNTKVEAKEQGIG